MKIKWRLHQEGWARSSANIPSSAQLIIASALVCQVCYLKVRLSWKWPSWHLNSHLSHLKANGLIPTSHCIPLLSSIWISCKMHHVVLSGRKVWTFMRTPKEKWICLKEHRRQVDSPLRAVSCSFNHHFAVRVSWYRVPLRVTEDAGLLWLEGRGKDASGWGGGIWKRLKDLGNESQEA